MILASGLLTLAVLLAPSPEARQAYDAGQAAVDAGDLAGAEAQFRRAVEIDPDYVRGWVRLATVVSWGERFKEATEFYEQALKIEPSDYDARLGLAKVSSWSGDYDKSIGTYESLLKDRPADRTVQLGLASVSSWAKEFPRSIEIYRAMLAEDPSDKEARMGLARVSSWAKDFDTAIREYRTLVSDDPGDRDAALGLARTLSWSGRLDESEETYRVLLDRDPKDVEARNGMAAVLSWDRRLDESLAMYEGTLEIEPGNADALAGRARVLWWQGRRPRAWEALDDAMRGHPEDPALMELNESIRSGIAPFVTATAGVMHDSDRNHIDSQSASFGYTPTPATTAGVTYRRFDATQPVGPGASLAARLESLTVQGTLRPGADLLITGSLGGEKISRRGGDSTAHATGSAGLSYRMNDAWTFGGVFSHETFAATALSLDHDVGVTSLSASATYRPFSSLVARFSAERANLTDANRRKQLAASARWSTPLKRPKLTLTWLERYFAYANGHTGAGRNGYFAPDSYWAHIAGAELSDNFSKRTGWRVEGTLGIQRVDAFFSSEATSDTVRGYGLSAWWEIRNGLRLEAYFARTNLALSSGGGPGASGSGVYKSTDNGVRLTWRIDGLHIGAYRDEPPARRAHPRQEEGDGAAMKGNGDD